MKQPTSDKVISGILARLDHLESAVMGKGHVGRGTKKKGWNSNQGGLPAYILKLREQGFFREPRIAQEVQVKLGKAYPCEQNRVAMALLRLQRRKQLRKASKIVAKKRQVAYVS